MIFHFLTEIPEKVEPVLDHESPDLTREETRIVKAQIRRNSVLIEIYLQRLDLFVNKERYPHREDFLQKIRRRLDLLMAENDTFRKVLWQHYLSEEIRKRILEVSKSAKPRA